MVEPTHLKKLRKSNWIISSGRGEHKKSLKPAPSFGLLNSYPICAECMEYLPAFTINFIQMSGKHTNPMDPSWVMDKLIWQWKNNHSKMYLVLKLVIFHWHVSFPRVMHALKQQMHNVGHFRRDFLTKPPFGVTNRRFGRYNYAIICPNNLVYSRLECHSTCINRPKMPVDLV